MSESSSLYQVFNDTPEEANLAKVIETLRGLSPRLMNTVAGVCMGLEPNIPIQEDQYAGDEAKATWDVKFRASVEANVKVLKCTLPINAAVVNHIACAVFIQRNRIKPRTLFDFMYFEFPEAFRGKAFIPSAELTEESTEEERESVYRAESDLWCLISDVLMDLNNEKFGSSEVDYHYSQKLESQVSTLMEREELVGKISAAGVREIVQMVVSETRSFVGESLPNSQFARTYIIKNIFADVLPVNYTLTDEEAVKIDFILEDLRKWAI